MTTELTIPTSYSGGIAKAIGDVTVAGAAPWRVILQPGVHPASTVDFLSGGTTRTEYVEVVPQTTRESVAIQGLTVHWGWTKLKNLCFAAGLRSDHVAMTTVLGSGSGELNNTMTSSQTTMVVARWGAYPQTGPFNVMCGTEQMQVTAGWNAGTSTANTLTLNVARAQAGTTAATHAAGSSVFLTNPAGGRDLTFTPLLSTGDPICVEFVDPRAANNTMSVSVGGPTGRWIEVVLGTGPNKYPNVTTTQVKAALEANAAVNALVTITYPGTQTGAMLACPFPRMPLTNRLVKVADCMGENIALVGCLFAGFDYVSWAGTSNAQRRTANVICANNDAELEWNYGVCISSSTGITDQHNGPVYIRRNRIYGTFAADAVFRPTKWDVCRIDENYNDLCVNPVGASQHVDSLQPLHGGVGLEYTNNTDLRQESQGILLQGGRLHCTKINNNLMQVYPRHDGLTGSINQIDQCSQVEVIGNTVVPDRNGFGGTILFDDGAGVVVQASLVNNICKGLNTAPATVWARNGHNLYGSAGSYSAGTGDTVGTATFVDDSHDDARLNDYRLAPSSVGYADGVPSYVGLEAPARDILHRLRPATPSKGCFEGSPVAEPPPYQFPVTGLLDDFNRADAATLGANWTQYLTVFTGTRDAGIISNRVGLTTGSVTQQVWYNPATFGPNTECYLVIATKPADADSVDAIVQVWARTASIAASTTDGYVVSWWAAATGDQMDVRRIDNGVGTVIAGPATKDLNAGDKIGISVIGTVVTAWAFTEGKWGRVLTVIDGVYPAGGRLGLAFSGVTTTRLANFSGGTVT